MIIKGLYIDGFGIFHDQGVDDLQPGFNVFFGLNESGKTTLFHFLRQMMFGLDTRKGGRRYEPLRMGSHGGRLSVVVGADEYVIERQRTSRTGAPRQRLYLPGGKEGDEVALSTLIPTGDEALFKNIFSFTIDELSNFSTLSNEKIRSAIFSAAMGLGHVSLADIEQKIDAATDKQYKPSGTKPIMNITLADAAQVLEKIRNAEEEIDHFDEICRKIDEKLGLVKKLGEKFSIRSAALKGAEALGTAFPYVNALVADLDELQRKPVVDKFPKDGEVRLAELLNDKKTAAQSISEYADAIKELESRAGTHFTDMQLLENANEVRKLDREYEHHRKARDDLGPVRRELASENENIQDVLLGLGPGWDEAKLVMFDASVVARDQIENLGTGIENKRRIWLTAEQVESNREVDLANAERERDAAKETLENTEVPSMGSTREIVETRGAAVTIHEELGAKLLDTLDSMRALRKARLDLERARRRREAKEERIKEQGSPGTGNKQAIDSEETIAEKRASASVIYEELSERFRALQGTASELMVAREALDRASKQRETKEEGLASLQEPGLQSTGEIVEKRKVLRALRSALSSRDIFKAGINADQAQVHELGKELDEKRRSARFSGIASIVSLALGIFLGAGFSFLNIAVGITAGTISILASVTAFVAYNKLKRNADETAERIEQRESSLAEKEKQYSDSWEGLVGYASLNGFDVENGQGPLDEYENFLEEEAARLNEQQRVAESLAEAVRRYEECSTKAEESEGRLTQSIEEAVKAESAWSDWTAAEGLEVSVQGLGAVAAQGAPDDLGRLEKQSLDIIGEGRKALLEYQGWLDTESARLSRLQSASESLADAVKHYEECKTTEEEAHVALTRASGETREVGTRWRDWAAAAGLDEVVSIPTIPVFPVDSDDLTDLETRLTGALNRSRELLQEYQCWLDTESEKLSTLERAKDVFATSEARLATCVELLDKAKGELNSALEMIEKAERYWREWLSSNGFTTTLSPEGALKSLEQVTTGRQLLRNRDRLSERVATMEETVCAFESKLRDVLLSCSREVVEEDHVGQAVRTLGDELKDSEESEKEKEAIKESIDDAERRMENKKAALRDIDSAIGALLQEAGVGTPGEFIESGRMFNERENLKSRIEANIKNVANILGPGRDIKEVIAELDGRTVEDIERQRAELEASVEEVQREIKEESGLLGELRNELERISSRDDISDLQLRLESLRTSLSEEAVSWAVNKSVLFMLRRARMQFQEQGQPEVVKEAIDVLTRITEGRYKNIVPSLEGDTIQVVRSDDEHLDHGLLSRGTQEQLYFALRLGYIKSLTRKGKTYPVLVDEALVNFDPDRFGKTIEGLSELSRDHQVLLFTCHPQTVRVVEEKLPRCPVYTITDGVIKKEPAS